jgi:hypothetical protein
MTSIYPNIRSVAPLEKPVPGVWYPYGNGHRVIFDLDGAFRVWDNYQWQHLGELLYVRVEQQLHKARGDKDGDLLAAVGWSHVTVGKIVGMVLEALDVEEIVAAITDAAVLVNLMMSACDSLT